MRKNIVIAVLIAISFVFSSCGGNRPSEENYESDTTSSAAQNLETSTSTPADRKFIKTVDLQFKVKNVFESTLSIEGNAKRFGGYTISSDIQHSVTQDREVRYTTDSLMRISQISYSNKIVVKVPSQQVDSFLHSIRPLIAFLDYRTITLTDVTNRSNANEAVTRAYDEAAQNMTEQVDSRAGKVGEAVEAEQSALNTKIAAAEMAAAKQQLQDDVRMSTVILNIYQKETLAKDVYANFDKVATDSQSFISRLGDSIAYGWETVKECFLFIVQLWGVMLYLALAVLAYYWVRKFVEKNRKK